MKNFGIAALSGAALLQGVSAACCRSNKCLKALALADFEGVMDCKSNLIVTVTPPASTYTETVTLIQSAVDTVLFTETTTEVASTATQILTEVVTVTSATETDFLTETVTVPYTTTLVSLLPEITSTSTVYQNAPTVYKLKARLDTLTQIDDEEPTEILTSSSSLAPALTSLASLASPALPTYATADCADWSQYSKACKCIGVSASTITASAAPVETVTVTASDALTTVVATFSSTSTDIISVTTTISDTETSTIGATDLITATATLTVSAVETVQATSTPVSVVPLMCKPRGQPFRASMVYPNGQTRYMNNVGIIAWQYGFSTTFVPGTQSALSTTWMLSNNNNNNNNNEEGGGYLQLAPGSGDVVAYVKTSDDSAGASIRVWNAPAATVDAGVAAGTMKRVKGCVSAATGELTLSAMGRSNILECGVAMYLSTNKDGKDVRNDCVLLTPATSY